MTRLRKVFIATCKSPEQQAKTFGKIDEAFNTTPLSAEEAEFIILDLEDPIPYRAWGKLAKVRLEVEGHPPPIILADLGETVNSKTLDGLDQITEPGKLPRCKTQEELLEWLYRIETLLPFYNKVDDDRQQVALPAEILSLLASGLKVKKYTE